MNFLFDILYWWSTLCIMIFNVTKMTRAGNTAIGSLLCRNQRANNPNVDEYVISIHQGNGCRVWLVGWLCVLAGLKRSLVSIMSSSRINLINEEDVGDGMVERVDWLPPVLVVGLMRCRDRQSATCSSWLQSCRWDGCTDFDSPSSFLPSCSICSFFLLNLFYLGCCFLSRTDQKSTSSSLDPSIISYACVPPWNGNHCLENSRLICSKERMYRSPKNWCF